MTTKKKSLFDKNIELFHKKFTEIHQQIIGHDFQGTPIFRVGDA